ncbi:MAG: glycosyltransferase family 2 protein [bacterium]
MKVFCVIPAFNEAKHISNIAKVKEKVNEVILVDDCSDDNTLELAKQRNVTVLHHIVNRGQGAALRTGTNYAINHGSDQDIIVHFDADGQMRAEDIHKVIEPLKHRADIVFGSRFLDNSTKMPRFKKHVIMPLAKLVNKIFLNVNLTDPQSGFRAMTIEAAKKLNWQQDGMAHCSEILLLAHKRKLKITEVPITIIYKNFGQKLSGGVRIIKDLIIAKLI